MTTWLAVVPVCGPYSGLATQQVFFDLLFAAVALALLAQIGIAHAREIEKDAGRLAVGVGVYWVVTWIFAFSLGQVWQSFVFLGMVVLNVLLAHRRRRWLGPPVVFFDMTLCMLVSFLLVPGGVLSYLPETGTAVSRLASWIRAMCVQVFGDQAAERSWHGRQGAAILVNAITLVVISATYRFWRRSHPAPAGNPSE